MIKTFTASPTTINNIDMSKLGEGTGITRYAAGMYFGGPSIVAHYLSDYKTYGAAEKKFYKHGVEVPQEAPGYPIMLFLSQNNEDLELAKTHYADNADALTMLELMFDDGQINFTVESGVCHEVSLRGIDDADLILWDDTVPEDVLAKAAQYYYDQQWDKSVYEKIDYEALDMEGDYISDYESLVEEAFDAAFLYAQEHSDLSPNDDDIFKEVWLIRARGDREFTNNFTEDFDRALSHTPQWKLIENMIAQGPEFHCYLTYGDLYEHLSHFLSPEPDSLEEHVISLAKQRTSQFFVKALDVPAFKCESCQGDQGAMEIVVIDERILKDSKFEPISHHDFAYEVEQEHVPLHRKHVENDEHYGCLAPRY